MKIKLTGFLLLFCFSLSYSQTVYDNFVDGRIYVKLQPGTAKDILSGDPMHVDAAKVPAIQQLVSKYGVTRITRPFHQASDDANLPYVLRIEFSKFSLIEDFIRALATAKNIQYAEKVPLMKTDVVPNETMPTHLNQINAPNAWNVYNGNSNITVAIVDNACMWTHVDLVQNTYTNTAEIAGNNIDDDGNGYVDDVNGYDVSDLDNNPIPSNNAMDHGTHCAGIAAGRTNNGIGIASIGWNIKFIPVKCQTNNGGTSTILNGYEGIIYATKAKARVISCSWGNTGSSTTEQLVIDYSWNRGCIIMASAGNNSNNTPTYPGAYNHVYCVGAINSSDVKSSYSNYGTWVDISAPGDNIVSTTPYTPTATPAYLSFSGTSMATPMVAGLAGLMLSKSPFMTQTDVLNCISNTAVNIYTLSGNSLYTSPNQLGAGRIEAFLAMSCAATYSALPPVANFYGFPLNTCPNTPVQFTDSSLYAPTSWSWVFQGGSPATSTLANPSVMWSTPGTYSVSLTVSNGSGSDTKTKLAYITVSGAISLPFTEGFQSTQFLPANWTPNNINNDAIYWQRKTGVGGFGTSTACAIFDNYNMNAPGERDEMRSPKFDFSTVASARLRFDVAYSRYSAFYSDTLEVKLSTNCGVSWTTIYIRGGSTLSTVPDQSAYFTPTSSQWRRDSIDISTMTAGQGNVMFSFINRGHYGQPIYLDNINLVFPTPSVSIITTSATCIGSPINFTVTALSGANYTWTSPGANPSTTTGLNPLITYTAPGLYTPTLTAVNGPSSATFSFNMAVNAYPVLSVNQPTICSGSTATLSASGATNYIWTGSSGTIGAVSNATATPASSSVYTVSGSTGFFNGNCVSTLTTMVVVNASPTVAVTDQTVCNGSSATLAASGASSYSWTQGPANGTIVVTPNLPGTYIYTVNGTTNNCSNTKTVSVTMLAPLSVSLTPTATVTCAGDPLLITASGAGSYSWSTGSNAASIGVTPSVNTVYTVTGLSGQCTGTAQITASVVPAPTINISASPSTSICPNNTISLTANGANSYSWSSVGAGSMVTIMPPTSAVYTVSGTNPGCSRTQTISITVIPSTVVVSLSASTNSMCIGNSVTINASGASSYSWNTGAITSGISDNPLITTSYSVTGTTNGCTGSSAITITVIPFPLSLFTTSNALCSNSCNGVITASTVTGVGPFTYSVSGSTCTQSTCANLCAGVYTMVVMGSGCGVVNIFTITSPPPMLSSITSSNASCATCNDGKASVVVTGGTAPHTFTWMPGALSGSSITALPGCYTVNISDNNGCASTASACIGFFTGIEEVFANKGFLIFPNPASSELTIQLKGHKFTYSLFDAVGQIIVKDNADDNAVISANTFAKGVYLLQVECEGYTVVKKIIFE